MWAFFSAVFRLNNDADKLERGKEREIERRGGGGGGIDAAVAAKGGKGRERERKLLSR